MSAEMKIETKGNFLELDFDRSSPSAYGALIPMIEVLNSQKLIDSRTIVKVRGLNDSLFTKLMVDLCNKLGYILDRKSVV